MYIPPAFIYIRCGFLIVSFQTLLSLSSQNFRFDFDNTCSGLKLV